jgi:matrix metalloproteinase-14 (membrane-inserted)
VKDLTYKISSYPTTPRLSKADVDSEIARALGVWAEFTDLTFSQRDSGRVHIDVRFEKREHGDGDPFDGQGGTLAHAFFPVFGGDAHFDDDEFWTKGTFVGEGASQVRQLFGLGSVGWG